MFGEMLEPTNRAEPMHDRDIAEVEQDGRNDGGFLKRG